MHPFGTYIKGRHFSSVTLLSTRQLAEGGRSNFLIHGRYLRYTEGTSDTWKVPQIHGRYLRYMEGTSDTWKVPQIHGRYLRYMEGTSDTWEVPQIHGRYLRYMEGTSDTWEVPQIHGRYLRYMAGTSDTWEVPQIHGRYLRYMAGTSDTWQVPQVHGRYLRYIYFVREVLNRWYDSTGESRGFLFGFFIPVSAALQAHLSPLDISADQSGCCFGVFVNVPATRQCISRIDLLDSFKCCHTEIEVAGRTVYLTQSQ